MSLSIGNAAPHRCWSVRDILGPMRNVQGEDVFSMPLLYSSTRRLHLTSSTRLVEYWEGNFTLNTLQLKCCTHWCEIQRIIVLVIFQTLTLILIFPGEVGRQVSQAPFDSWNCVTGLLINLSTIPVWSAPPSVCPAPCQAHTTCTSCLKSEGGGSGGLAACYWSNRLNSVSVFIWHIRKELTLL